MLNAFRDILNRAYPFRIFSDETGESSHSDTEPVSLWRYEPTFSDVIVVKAMLNQALTVPVEIVDQIVDFAEYWPHTTAESGPADDINLYRTVRGGQGGTEDELLIRTQPLGFPRILGSKKAEFTKKAIDPGPLKQEFTTEQFQQYIKSPVAMLQHPCRKIVFTIESRDQGWGNRSLTDNKYGASWTWFSVGLERLEADSDAEDAEAVTSQLATSLDSPTSLRLDKIRTIWPESRPVEPQTAGAPEQWKFHHELHPQPDRMIQANLTVHRQTTEHRVVWSCTDDIDPESEEGEKLVYKGRGKATGSGEFVRSLKLGDIVSVWAHARFPGWGNYVRSVKIEVYYAV